MKATSRRKLLKFIGLAYLNPTLPGQMPRRIKTKNRLFIESTVIKNNKSENDFPQVRVLLVNDTSQDQVIVEVIVRVLDYKPYFSVPESRVLKPLAVVDIELPLHFETVKTRLERPVLVASGDSATVHLRLFVKYMSLPVPPRRVAGFRLRFGLTTAQGVSIETSEVSI